MVLSKEARALVKKLYYNPKHGFNVEKVYKEAKKSKYKKEITHKYHGGVVMLNETLHEEQITLGWSENAFAMRVCCRAWSRIDATSLQIALDTSAAAPRQHVKSR